MENIIRREHVNENVGDDLEFVLSDGSIDRLSTVLEPDGWQLANFRANPIALLNHNPDAIIGSWENIRVEGKALKARFQPAEQGTSPRIDEIRSLVRQKILRAASVGFRILSTPREGERGIVIYPKNELLEASIVSVPANPGALAAARSLNVSRETLALVFGKSAMEGARDDHVSPGKSAATEIRSSEGNRTMTTIAERIEAAQNAHTASRAALETHLGTLDNDNVSDAQMQRTKELNAEMSRLGELISVLRQSEINIGNGAAPAGTAKPPPGLPAHMQGQSNLIVTNGRPFAVAKKEVKPVDYLFRAAAVMTKHGAYQHGTRPLTDTIREGYGEDAVLKGYLDVVTRAATIPADTTTVGWAKELVETSIGEYFDALLPMSVYPALRVFGGRYTFGRAGQISLPTRSTTPTVAGSFFAQGAPIPVRQAAFTAVVLVIKKMGVITVMTREIREHSIPALEGILRQAMQEDTQGALDAVLLDANPVTTIRPAGLLNGATTAAGTAGGGIAAVIADIKGMIGSLITATAGNVRVPVWIMNPAQAIALTLTQNAGGDFPFSNEVNGGRFRGYPLIQSTILTPGTVVLIDAADFFSASGDDPRIDVSDQAVLHMEDTTPLAIGTPGAPATVAAPTRSLWQTDCIGIRLILDVNWQMRRTGMVVTRTAVTW
jgi:HK97 family phage prohead protease